MAVGAPLFKLLPGDSSKPAAAPSPPKSAPATPPPAAPAAQKQQKQQQQPPVAAATQEPDAAGSRGTRRVPLSRMRQRIAQRLKEAQNTAASLTTFNEIDMSRLMKVGRICLIPDARCLI